MSGRASGHVTDFGTALASTSLGKLVDAANIDLKGFTEGFYKNLCSGSSVLLSASTKSNNRPLVMRRQSIPHACQPRRAGQNALMGYHRKSLNHLETRGE